VRKRLQEGGKGGRLEEEVRSMKTVERLKLEYKAALKGDFSEVRICAALVRLRTAERDVVLGKWPRHWARRMLPEDKALHIAEVMLEDAREQELMDSLNMWH
jgi:hypothetical protein